MWPLTQLIPKTALRLDLPRLPKGSKKWISLCKYFNWFNRRFSTDIFSSDDTPHTEDGVEVAADGTIFVENIWDVMKQYGLNTAFGRQSSFCRIYQC